MLASESETISPTYVTDMTQSARRMSLGSRLLAGTRNYADSVSRSGQFAHTVRGERERWRRETERRREAEEEGVALQHKGNVEGRQVQRGQIGLSATLVPSDAFLAFEKLNRVFHPPLDLVGLTHV